MSVRSSGTAGPSMELPHESPIVDGDHDLRPMTACGGQGVRRESDLAGADQPVEEQLGPCASLGEAGVFRGVC